jgi:hypothetical protein
VDGLELLGAFPQRNNDATAQLDGLPPTLTVCGDLDGLIRTSRIAETYYHYFVYAKNNINEAKMHNPVGGRDGEKEPNLDDDCVFVQSASLTLFSHYYTSYCQNHFQTLQGQAPSP